MDIFTPKKPSAARDSIKTGLLTARHTPPPSPVSVFGQGGCRQTAADFNLDAFIACYNPGLFGGRIGQLKRKGIKITKDIVIQLALKNPSSATAKALRITTGLKQKEIADLVSPEQEQSALQLTDFQSAFLAHYRPGILGGSFNKLKKMGVYFTGDIALQLAAKNPACATAKALKQMVTIPAFSAQTAQPTVTGLDQTKVTELERPKKSPSHTATQGSVALNAQVTLEPVDLFTLPADTHLATPNRGLFAELESKHIGTFAEIFFYKPAWDGFIFLNRNVDVAAESTVSCKFKTPFKLRISCQDKDLEMVTEIVAPLLFSFPIVSHFKIAKESMRSKNSRFTNQNQFTIYLRQTNPLNSSFFPDKDEVRCLVRNINAALKTAGIQPPPTLPDKDSCIGGFVSVRYDGDLGKEFEELVISQWEHLNPIFANSYSSYRAAHKENIIFKKLGDIFAAQVRNESFECDLADVKDADGFSLAEYIQSVTQLAHLSLPSPSTTSISAL